MSLTDDERRRLAALEDALTRQDPELARRVDRLGRRFPAWRALRLRWVLLGASGTASAGLLTLTLIGSIPALRSFAILLNIYVIVLAALLWNVRNANDR